MRVPWTRIRLPPPQSGNPLTIYRGLSWALWARKPERAQDPPRVWKKSFGDFFETFSRLSRRFQDFFQTLGGVPGPEVPGDFLLTFSGFRAWRARETPVNGQRAPHLTAVHKAAAVHITQQEGKHLQKPKTWRLVEASLLEILQRAPNKLQTPQTLLENLFLQVIAYSQNRASKVPAVDVSELGIASSCWSARQQKIAWD